MKIIFMGTPGYAQSILQKMIDTEGLDLVAVYTQPDKPVGRKKVLTAPPVKELALQYNIDLYQPDRLRDEACVADLLKIECDFIVVAAYGQILPKAILDHAPCINLHASILPEYRGASPIQQILLNGDKQTGVSAMLMEEGLDTGAIIKIQKIDVPDDMMVEELFISLTKVAAELTIDVLQNYHSYPSYAQDDSKASLCKKITKADGEVCFDDAQTLYNKYRAFTPWPGVYLQSGLKLKEMILEDIDSENKEGQILSIDSNSVHIGCKKGSIRIVKVQPQSKKEMDISAYVNGKRLTLEDTLS